jgi:hypothetical protein
MRHLIILKVSKNHLVKYFSSKRGSLLSGDQDAIAELHYESALKHHNFGN